MSVAWHVTSHGILKDMEEPDPITQPRLAAYVIETDGKDLDDEARDHIADTFRMYCHCPHDCCGHRTGGVISITRVWEGRYVALVSSQLNY